MGGKALDGGVREQAVALSRYPIANLVQRIPQHEWRKFLGIGFATGQPQVEIGGEYNVVSLFQTFGQNGVGIQRLFGLEQPRLQGFDILASAGC